MTCRKCKDGVISHDWFRERCPHCSGSGSYDPAWIAMLNTPILHPISGQDCATHARRPDLL